MSENMYADKFLADYEANLRERSKALEAEERFNIADDRAYLANFVAAIRNAMSGGKPFAESRLYVEPGS